MNSKASKKLKAGKAKKKVNLPNFEKKVMKSKMITANLQKQRIRNMERFKTLIREVDGAVVAKQQVKEAGHGVVQQDVV